VLLVLVVVIGGYEMVLFLSCGECVVCVLCLYWWLCLDVVFVLIVIFWGFDVGDIFGYVLFLVKIMIEVFELIDVVVRFGDDVDVVYDVIVVLM